MATATSTGDSNDRLNKINVELSQILEERLDFLNKTLSETQGFTEKIASAELELQRHSGQQARLRDECADLDGQLAALSARVETALNERTRKQEELEAYDLEARKLEAELTERRRESAEAQDRIRNLDAQASELERDNAELERELGRRNDKIGRLKQIRQEFISRIEALDHEEAGLSSLQK